MKIKSASRSFLLVLTCSLFVVTGAYSQKNRSYSFFRMLYSGENKGAVEQFKAEGDGSLMYKDTLLHGRIIATEKNISLISESKVSTYNYNDTALSCIYIENKKGHLNFVRLKEFDNKLWRLIKDTLGMQLYDKNISYPADGNNIDYASLIFCNSTRSYEAVAFWVTSTKRNIIKIINHLLGFSLNPKQFSSKENLLNRIINNDRIVFQKPSF